MLYFGSESLGSNVSSSLVLLLLGWLVYMIFFVRFLFATSKLDIKRRKKLVSRLRKRFGAPRLCGYHIGLTMRRGEMAIVDGKNCELCKKEK